MLKATGKQARRNERRRVAVSFPGRLGYIRGMICAGLRLIRVLFLKTRASFMLPGALRLALAVVLTTGAASPAWASDTFTVGPELWDRPRSGGVVLEQPAVKQAVNALLARSGASLVIHHAAGQEPLLQAEELRAWLVALAVETGRVSLRSGLKAGEPLKIEVLR